MVEATGQWLWMMSGPKAESPSTAFSEKGYPAR